MVQELTECKQSKKQEVSTVCTVKFGKVTLLKGEISVLCLSFSHLLQLVEIRVVVICLAGLQNSRLTSSL